jgi:uncharacterized membrane protein
MSDNLYAPPQAVLSTSHEVGEGSGTVDVGRCMQEAWRDTWANFPLWLVAGLVWTLASVAGAITVIGILLVLPILYWGGYVFFLKMHDGGARVGDVFAGFSRYGQALLGMLGYAILTILLGLPGNIVTQIGARSSENVAYLYIGLGGLLAVFIGLFVTPRLNFAPFLMVDRNLGLADALSETWSRTSQVKLPLALLTLLMGAAMLVGALALLVGIFPGFVFALLLWVSAYRQIFGGTRQH